MRNFRKHLGVLGLELVNKFLRIYIKSKIKKIQNF